MSERKPAPGMVLLRHGPNRGDAFAYCEGGCAAFGDKDPLPDAYPTIAAAADALREHLRTEHADLWRECTYCRGQGKVGGPYWMPPPGLIQCRLCHGRGYIETERSKA